MHKPKTHIAFDVAHADASSPEKVLSELLLKVFAESSTPVVIAIGGPGGTGKSTFAKKLRRLLGHAAVLPLDDYKTPRHVRKGRNIFGPHPDANTMDLAAEHISLVKQNVTFDKPVYDNITGRTDTTETFSPKRFNILDGEISTYHDFREHVDFSIFIDAHYKTQLATRTSRDIEERGYTWEKAIETFLHSNLREYTKYGAESKNWADMHIYCNADYSLSIQAIATDFHSSI
jgi:uridine kinase